MTDKQKAFFKQLNGEEMEAREDFLSSYAFGQLDEHVKDPLQHALAVFNSEWQLDKEATPESVQLWIEDEKAVNIARMKAEQVLRKEKAVQIFREQRQSGATFLESVKATGEDPAYMARVLENVLASELCPEQLRVLRLARVEDHKVTAYEKRQKTFDLIQGKVEKAMEDADFSSLPPDKLADILFKLSQLTKDEKPPEMSISFGFNRHF